MDKKEKLIFYVLLTVLFIVLLFLFAVKYREKIFGLNRVLVYFTIYDESLQKAHLSPVTRKIAPVSDTEERIRRAIEELLKGPSADEKEKGFASAMPEKASLLNVYIQDGTVHLDFSKDIEKGGGSMLMMERLAQIVFTATQFDSIKNVRFQIEGSLIEYFSGEGITDVDSPVSRENFREFLR
ncbi:MAG TPA: GerMN domain-containing protein [bacterium]|nr:GerMN domain-containing protein [bacterium]